MRGGSFVCSYYPGALSRLSWAASFARYFVLFVFSEIWLVVVSSSGRILDIPPRPDQVFRLDLAGANLPILRALLDIRDELLLLVLQLDPFPVKFALSLFEGALVFAKALGGRHSLAKGPFYYIHDGCVLGTS